MFYIVFTAILFNYAYVDYIIKYLLALFHSDFIIIISFVVLLTSGDSKYFSYPYH